MDVKETLLPGVGLRYEFENSDGQRVGVVAHRGGDIAARNDGILRAGGGVHQVGFVEEVAVERGVL